MSVVIYLSQWIIGIAVILLTILYLYFKHLFNYWKKLGFPCTQDPAILYGDLKGVMSTKSMSDVYADLYEKTKKYPICGFWAFNSPSLTINDPDLIRLILNKEFNTFSDRKVYADVENDPLSGHLFSLDGAAWRNIRVKLTPTFTSGKMKFMYSTMLEIVEELVTYLKNHLKQNSEIECKDILSRFTTDVIGSCAFGIKVDSINNPKSIFREMGTRALRPPFLQSLSMIVTFFAPKIAEKFKLRATGRDVEEFFVQLMRETIDHRKSNGIVRNDFLQLLMQLMDKGVLEDVDSAKGKTSNDHKPENTKFTFNEAVAQAFAFFLGGFEPTSASMQFSLYEMALNQDIQEKLYNEIVQVLKSHNGQMTYEAISEMVYLGKIIDETTRKYPAAPLLLRVCGKDFQVPDMPYVIPEGTPVHINICGLHHDERYYPNPSKFDPERFSHEENAKRNPYVFIPFGEGPRVCIGNRFVLLQMKLALASLIRHFTFKTCDKTPKVIKADPKVMVFTVIGGMVLKVEPRQAYQ